MADKKFSELETASEIKNGDFLALSQDTGNGKVSLKATILALATKMLTAINFTSALTTTDKTVIGAINEVAEGGGGGGTDVIAEDFDSTATYAVGDYCIYEGSLYKCTTAVTTAGDWDSSDWTETLVMDEVEQGGGGGGAGHTIKDDSGNALTQRSNLQFKGVYSHDDSTNGASVVEVAREMTWAEYQQLSASEKKGLITITDRYTADAMFVDGVFIDTDNIIKNDFTFDSTGHTWTATEDCIIAGNLVAPDAYTGAYIWVDNITCFNCYEATSGNGFNIPVKKGQVVTYRAKTGATNNNMAAYGLQASTNPSIPDYSTTEHKTGRKWIDGKDIWEKTIHLASGSIGSSHELVVTNDLSGIARIIEKTGSVHDTSENRDYHLPYLRLAYTESILFQCFVKNNNSVAISLLSNSNYSLTDIDITLQYTKTS